MFEKVALRLLAGEFLCEVAAPDSFRWLAEEENSRDMNEYLGRIGRKLSATTNQRAYFAAWATVGTGERADIKRTFTAIKQELGPAIQFIAFCMDVEHRDVAVTAGDVLDYATLLKAIADSAHLGEQLRLIAGLRAEFVSSTDGTHRGMLDRILKQLEKWGYLLSSNAHGSISYRFTGKVDYLYEVIEFLRAHESGLSGLVEREDEPSASGSLL